MMAKLQIKKQKKPNNLGDLETFSKEELIIKIKSLCAENVQLKNIISKSASKETSKNLKMKKKPFDFSKCNFRHILLKFFYLGWDHQGFAVQDDTANTVEHYLFEALIKTCLIEDRKSSNYHRCGRTDKGVSAFAQVISLDVRSKLPKDRQQNFIEELDYCKILNRVLPDNIQCIAWCPVRETFSARFDCKERTYKYFFPKGNLNIEKMRDASLNLLGTHDFRNLCKMDVGNGVVEFVRNIVAIDIQPCFSHDQNDEYSMYVITITGQAFLWHQIRCIMGVLLLIGQGKEEPIVISELLDVNKNPRKPDYNMANEVPLILYSCDYKDDLYWYYDRDSLNLAIDKLKRLWTFSAIKTTMMKTMLDDLQITLSECRGDNVGSKEEKCLSEFLIDGAKSKTYVPLMKRQKCCSLEDKIEHFRKRSRIEVTQVDLQSKPEDQS